MSSTPQLENPVAIARAGMRFLMVSYADYVAENRDAQAQVHDLDTGLWSEPRPLQVYFKWETWEDAKNEDYLTSIAEDSARRAGA